MCKAHRFDGLAGLEINTWCGTIDSDNSAVTVCDIGDNCKPIHYVQIRNTKVLNRKILVKGITFGRHAKFEGDSSIVTSEVEWTSPLTISSGYGLDTEQLAEVIISKRKKGDERIRVEIEYFDQWDPLKKTRADQDDLEFRVRVT